MRTPIKILTFGTIAALSVSVFAAQAVRSLIIDGKTASMNVIQAGGHYVVPVEDVAKFFGYTVTVDGSKATFTKVPNQPNQNGGQNTNSQNQNNNQNPNNARNNPQPGQSQENNGSSGAPMQFLQSTQSPMTNASSAVPGNDPNDQPMQVFASVGQPASLAGFDYNVVSISTVGQKYKEAYDQRREVLSAKWKTDSLVVVTFEVTNRGRKATQVQLPNVSDISVFDNKKVGYHAAFLDIPQSTDVVAPNSLDNLRLTDDSTSNVTLGPGGTLRFAAIASIPRDSSVSSVEYDINKVANSDGTAPSSGIVTISQ